MLRRKSFTENPASVFSGLLPSRTRRTRGIVFAILAAVLVTTVHAAELGPATSNQAQYVRWHDSAVAFADSMEKISGRYDGMRAADLTQARQLISGSEQAAQRQDFDGASQQARQAYELLRSSITGAVTRSRQSAQN